MQDKANRLVLLVDRLRQMSAGDRNAILSQLALDQRLTLEELLANPAQPEEPVPPSSPPSADNRLFSTTLARMLDELATGSTPLGGEGLPLSTATCTALSEAAATIRADQQGAQSKDKDPASFGALFNRLLFPERRP